ncbi:hypothetical protein CF326_g4177, partial [Tilletia indica]
MLPNPKRPRKRQATSKRSARSESSAAPHQAPLPSSSSGPFNDDINPVPIYQDFSAFDLGGLDDWSYQNQDQDIVGGEEPGDGTAGLNEAQVYAEMLFSQQSAYVARIDHRTWVLEGNANGICQEGQFYHVTLYEGTNMTGADEQLASCDCPAGRNGHAYEQHAPGTRLKFLHRSTFVKLYFAYISLQQLDVDFSCQLCGPTPSIVIADGVVLAYNASFRLAELSPPTTTGSDINDSVRSGSITPFLPIPAARAALKQLAEVLVSDPDQCLQPLQQLKIAVDDAKAMAPILRLWVGRLQQLLVDICLAASLGSLSPSLKSALQQLVAQFAANEGVLQLCRPLCCPILVNLSTIKLEEAPKELLVRLSTTLSRHCPFLGNVFVCLAHDDLNAAEKSMRTSLQALMASTAQVVDHQMTLLNARTPPSSAS